ncbi:ribbon-helix-helix domain-containing protein [Ornithinimicrobium avium]|uniref:Ribbon-helix-helix protein, CopG family n=1 Tax=Ornithinimicrobium avium TaxID=2283195 RepID=A0A345NPV8_9MICO|nr:ribbon-helix-helix domain-containing protein [Ornithinimicrobium avium]AXH97066.1 ribbon-helix-helix protein, CopG family [Ornithinimicrobium avium]
MTVRKVAVTLPEELYEMLERARSAEHRSRSEVIQEALRTHFGEPIYRPTDEERAALVAALDAAQVNPESLHDWSDVRKTLPGRR